MSNRAAGVLAHGPAVWVLVPALAAVTTGSVWVTTGGGRSHTAATQVQGEKLVAGGSGSTNSTGATGSFSAGAGTSSTGNGNGGVGNGNGVGNGAGSVGKAFKLSGIVGGLAPGNPVTLMVHVDNSGNNQALLVTHIDGTATAVTGGGGFPNLIACDFNWVTVAPYDYPDSSGKRYVALARSATDVPVIVTFTDLSGTNQDNCKGATFTVALKGTGQQA